MPRSEVLGADNAFLLIREPAPRTIHTESYFYFAWADTDNNNNVDHLNGLSVAT